MNCDSSQSSQMDSMDDDSRECRRKSSKPAMEKKRRARINASLLELKSLLLEVMKQEGCRHSKMEKADILEMTTKHLRQLQRQQFAAATSSDPNVTNRYKLGFNECANEVIRYLGNVERLDVEMRARLLQHLSTCIQDNTRSQRPGRMTSSIATTQQTLAQKVAVVPNNSVGVASAQKQFGVEPSTAAQNNTLQLTTAKLVNGDGSEITVVIGMPTNVIHQNANSQQPCYNVVLDNKQQLTSQEQQFYHVVSLPSQRRMTSSTITNNVTQLRVMPMNDVALHVPVTSHVVTSTSMTSSPLLPSPVSVDGSEKTYHDVRPWHEEHGDDQEPVWRPW